LRRARYGVAQAAHRHCERSEAIQAAGTVLDCFVAPLLAMTAQIYYLPGQDRM
jgi:hypothetical protein